MKNYSRKIKLVVVGNLQSVHLQKYCSYFSKKNYDIHFITPFAGEFKGITVYDLSGHNFRPRFLSYLWKGYRTRKIIRKLKPDLVHAFDMVACGVWAYFANFHPFIASSWASDVFEIKMFNSLQRFLIKRSLAKADYLILQSDAIFHRILDLGIKKASYDKIQFGIDTELFKPTTQVKLPYKQKPKMQYILYPRNIEPVYLHEVAIKAFKEVLKLKPNVRLVLLDHSAYPDYYEEVKGLVKKSQLEDKVIYLPRAKNSDMPGYYKLADVVLSIPRSDGVSIVMLEAMAMKKQIVVSKLPYIREWEAGENLWVAKTGSSVDTAKNILLALNCSRAKKAKMGRINRAIVKEKADININFKKLDSLYKIIIK